MPLTNKAMVSTLASAEHKRHLQLRPFRFTDGSIWKETNKPSCQVPCHITPICSSSGLWHSFPIIIRKGKLNSNSQALCFTNQFHYVRVDSILIDVPKLILDFRLDQKKCHEIPIRVSTQMLKVHKFCCIQLNIFLKILPNF